MHHLRVYNGTPIANVLQFFNKLSLNLYFIATVNFDKRITLQYIGGFALKNSNIQIAQPVMKFYTFFKGNELVFCASSKKC